MVGLFLLLIMVYNFSSIIFELEWDESIHNCVEHWVAANVSRSWLAERPGGATWSCADVCVIPFNFSTTEDEFAGAFEGSSGAMGSGALYGAPTVASYIELEGSPRYACQTCVGFPPGHPECLHVPWAQTFTTITDAIWYNIVTITTVGYGDIYPTSNFARFFAIFIIVAGVVTFLPIPLAIVGNTFSRVWLEKEQVKLRGILRQMLSEQGISPTDFTQAFVQFDTDGARCYLLHHRHHLHLRLHHHLYAHETSAAAPQATARSSARSSTRSLRTT